MTSDNKPTESILEKLAGGPSYGLLVAGTLTAAGLIASFAHDDITNAWPLVRPWPGWNALRADVLIYWGLLIGWIVLYFLRENVKGKQVRRLHNSAADTIVAVNRLHSSTADIKEALQTLPPVSFVGDYAEIVHQSHLTLGRILPRQANPNAQVRASRSQLAKAIRGLLVNLGGLAYTYDSRDVIYGVNVMLFVARDDPDFANLDESKIRRFLSPGFDHKNLKGVLHLRPDLSVVDVRAAASSPDMAESPAPPSVAAPDAAPPPPVVSAPTAQGSVALNTAVKQPPVAPAAASAKFYEVIFGIPNKEYTKDHKGRWRVLPGSPMAYVQWDSQEPTNLSRAVRYVHDFQGLRNKETHGHVEFDLDPDVLDALEEDYADNGPGGMVRSFLAFPLVNENNEAVGTLNVHCSKAGILGDTNKGRIFNFTAVVSPLVNEIATLVTAWMRAK